MLKLLLIITLLFFIFTLFNNNQDTSIIIENVIKIPNSYDKYNIYKEDQSFY